MIRLLKAFFSAMLLFNAIPHLVQGICGESHMTPFAIISAPAVNVIWAWVNLLIG
jgi:energy-converting hydrogenase Eha subunit H